MQRFEMHEPRPGVTELDEGNVLPDDVREHDRRSKLGTLYLTRFRFSGGVLEVRCHQVL